MRVLIADDHPMFRAGLVALLTSDERVSEVHEVGTGGAAVALAAELLPDVVVMDLHMPDMDGVAATRELLARVPGANVLVLSMADDDSAVLAALQAGARGYLLKDADPVQILAGISSVAAGASVFGPRVAGRIAQLLADPASAVVTSSVPAPARVPGVPTAVAFPQLTAREREVLDLIASGHDNTSIVRRLVISPKTLRNHISAIFAKLEVHARSEAIVRAREAGLGIADVVGGADTL